MVIRLDRSEARRLAVRAQLLTADRPASIVETIYGLTVVNIEPTAAIAPSSRMKVPRMNQVLRLLRAMALYTG